MTDILTLFLEENKKRDLHILQKFCDEGSYIDGHGTLVVGVCKHVEISELLNLLHNADERLLSSIKTLLPEHEQLKEESQSHDEDADILQQKNEMRERNQEQSD